jgi:histidinol phosphatase-like enzyme
LPTVAFPETLVCSYCHAWFDCDRDSIGATIAAVEASTGVHATIVGKPSAWLINRLLDTHQFDRKRTCMVGDRLDSDMLFAKVASLMLLIRTSHTQAERRHHRSIGSHRMHHLRPYRLLTVHSVHPNCFDVLAGNSAGD